jgi:AcrR family transcriptional regulator
VATSTEVLPVDGRRARRERNRALVVDAMFELVRSGRHAITVDDIAEVAGVSPSSVFRYFDGLDDLQHQTVSAYFERFAPLFEVESASDREGRIANLVDARLALYDATAPIARLARARALDHDPLAGALASTRDRLTRQIASHFDPDLARLGRAERTDRVALIDTLTSFESWDLLATAHGRSPARIRRAWTTGLAAVLDR